MAVALLIGAGLGLVARRRYAIAAAAFIAFGVVGFVASLGDPLANAGIVAVAAAISVGVGLWVLGWLLDGSRSRSRRRREPARHDGQQMPDWSRRSFLIRAGGVGVAAVAAGVVGRNLLERGGRAPVGDGPAVPPASVTVPAADAGRGPVDDDRAA